MSGLIPTKREAKALRGALELGEPYVFEERQCCGSATCQALIRRGWVVYVPPHWKLTPEGLRMAEAVAQKPFDCRPETC